MKKILILTIAVIILMSLFAVPALAAGKNGPAGKSNIGHLYLYEKNPETWEIVDGGAWGKMKYNLSGPTFDFVFNGHGLEVNTNYSLIYYADPWPGSGGALITEGTSSCDGTIHLAGSKEFDGDLTDAKIWLVLSSDYDGTKMTAWNPTEYLFENNLITYTDTDPVLCVTIQDGVLVDSADNLLSTGYDQWGYNYQAHIFNGRYCDYDREIGGDYCDVNLVMKWNDAWLSNKSCDGDFLLDRHLGCLTYIGSGAWCTNHQSGSYEGDDGKMHKWVYFVKIVAAPADAYKNEEIWYTADGTEIGPAIWGDFATIQSVYNDPYDGYHGVEYLSPAGPGLGKW